MAGSTTVPLLTLGNTHCSWITNASSCSSWAECRTRIGCGQSYEEVDAILGSDGQLRRKEDGTVEEKKKRKKVDGEGEEGQEAE